MEVILASVFSIIIVFITTFSMVKVLNIAYKREEISHRKLIVFSTSTIVIGLLIASFLPFAYQRVFDFI